MIQQLVDLKRVIKSQIEQVEKFEPTGRGVQLTRGRAERDGYIKALKVTLRTIDEIDSQF